ncbi:MAG: acyl-CoA dehydrogenase family protein [Candidatus Dormibacteria bacterium]
MDFTWSPEQEVLRKTVREFAETELRPGAYLEHRPEGFVRERARRLAELGLTGMTFPLEYGGQSGSLLDAVIALSEVARVCPHTGDVLHAYNFGAIRQVAHLAGARLRERVLAPAIRGEIVLSLAMSESEAGSDLSGICTTAVVHAGRVVVTGSKLFATNGLDADWIVVWCRFGTGSRGLGAVVVPSTAAGFTRSRPMSFMSGEKYCQMFFDDCEVPVDNVLVNGNGLQRLMPVFNVERLGNAVRSVALAEAALECAVAYVRERRVGGRLLKDRQGIRWKVADMRVKLDAAHLLIYRAAAMAGGPSDEVTSVAKYFANETAASVADDALQLCGAYGYSVGSPVEYIYRRVRGWKIAGGTVEVLRDRIGRRVLQD